jgi:hypothetical protein
MAEIRTRHLVITNNKRYRFRCDVIQMGVYYSAKLLQNKMKFMEQLQTIWDEEH